MYNQLASTAPEITGLWDFTQIPGTLKENGTIDRTEAASGTAAVMVKGANVSPAWEFLKWWVGADAQYAFAMETELLMGAASRATPANIEALARLPWNEKQIRALAQLATSSLLYHSCVSSGVAHNRKHSQKSEL